jgi:hypothetical protein
MAFGLGVWSRVEFQMHKSSREAPMLGTHILNALYLGIWSWSPAPL